MVKGLFVGKDTTAQEVKVIDFYEAKKRINAVSIGKQGQGKKINLADALINQNEV